MAPSRIIGQQKSTMGSMQARVAGFFGFHGKASQHRSRAMAGSSEKHAANVNGWADGTGQRVRGKGHSILGAITGNRARQTKGNALNNVGQVRQNFNSRV